MKTLSTRTAGGRPPQSGESATNQQPNQHVNLYRRKSCPSQKDSAVIGSPPPPPPMLVGPRTPVGWHTPTPPAPLGWDGNESPSAGWVCSPPAPVGWHSPPPPPISATDDDEGGWDSPSLCSCASLDQESPSTAARASLPVHPAGIYQPEHGRVYADEYGGRVVYKDNLHCSYSVGDELHCTLDQSHAYYR